jgi:lipopolysaccharide export LptBFGC system permease protein LptF
MTDPAHSDPFETRGRARHSDPGRTGTLIFGLVVLALGIWFFAERTLGIDLPRIQWSTLWPIILIALGAWILLGAARRRG